MPEIRMLTNEEMKEAVRLSDATFRDEEQASMGQAFPFIFSDAAYHVSFGAFEDGQLLSFTGLVPWVVRIGEARLRVFSLGSVCTHPDARGQGLAGQLLEQVMDYIREAGASLLFVSGTRSLYTRAGCALFGRVRRYGLEPAWAGERLAAFPPTSHELRLMRPADLFALEDLAEARTVRYQSGVKELAAMIKSESLASCMKMKHRVWVAEEYGQLQAFAVMGVPDDPRNRGILLEHAGDPDAVIRLAAHAAQQLDGSGLDFPVAWHETELHARLAGVRFTEEDNAGTVRIVDGGSLMKQLQPWMARQESAIGASLHLEENKDGNWLLQTGSVSLALNPQQLVRLLFDQATTQEPLPNGANGLKGIFPAPLPYTGGLAFI